MPSIDEVFIKMRTDFLADPGLTTLLGQNDGIFRSFPAGNNNKPFLILNLDTRNAQTQISGAGVYRPDFTIDVFSFDHWEADKIYSHLVQNWTIPEERPAGIVSTNYRIDILRFPDMIELPGRVTEADTGEQLILNSIQTTGRIVKNT